MIMMKKKKVLASFALCFSAVLFLVGCGCCWAYPGTQSVEVGSSAVSDCHSQAEENHSKQESAKDCCGKCEIEISALAEKMTSLKSPSEIKSAAFAIPSTFDFTSQRPAHSEAFIPSESHFQLLLQSSSFAPRAPPVA
ncbi:MAG: hypothetical protein KBC91_05700 [Candidatus Omnitrophica bacterium]|jgi:hypothetical protein|nr:hypothetical protein [Candidatus Omnitrophota bacterium]